MKGQNSEPYPQVKPSISVRNAAQIGGVYHQVLEVGNYFVATRTGGIEVFRRSDDRLIPISHLPLTATPMIRKGVGRRVRAEFRTLELELSVDRHGRLSVIGQTSLASRGDEKTEYCRVIKSNGKSYTLRGANEGIHVTGRGFRPFIIPLDGYSKPSSIYLTSSGKRVVICDVGAIRVFKWVSDSLVPAGGYFAFGWPKDIVAGHGEVFCADVYGVRWYHISSGYPFLKEVCALARPHFRIAKLLNRNGRLIACDEVRGLHFLEATQQQLRPCGGIMLEGGAWGCVYQKRRLYIASGEGGWSSVAFDWRSWKCGEPRMHRGWGRVHKVLPWDAAHLLVVLSSKGIQVFSLSNQDASSDKPGNRMALGPCWEALPIGKFLVVAASERGVLVLSHDASRKKTRVISTMSTVEARVLAYDGRWLWVGDGKGGVRCCSFNRQSGDLRLAAIYPVAGFVRGMCCDKGIIYVAAGDGGLVCLKTH